MHRISAIKDILKVSISNIIKLLAGVLVGFLLPRIIGVTDYGYYKTFTLYATYVGLFHFGINDGIYLYFGGKDFKELNKKDFRGYFRSLLFIELSISIIVAAIAIFALEADYRFIFLCLSIYLVFNNLTVYFQYISQATRRFSELSIRNIIQSMCISLGVIVCAYLYRYKNVYISYKTYTIIYISVFAFLTFWYIYTYRSITIGKGINNTKAFASIVKFVKLGMPLMIANLCSSLILSLDRQFVNILFSTNTYAVYAFAYNMLALITTATSAVAVVLYPNLKRMDDNTLKIYFDRLVRIILIIVFVGLSSYFPLNLFVNWFLPQYSNSLPIFRIIYPGLAVSSAVTIVIHNYYKTTGKNLLFFRQSVVILVISGCLNFIAYRIFGTTNSISWASIFTMIMWYLISISFFVKKYYIRWVKTFIYMIIMMLAFYSISLLSNQWVGMIIYFLVFCIISIIFFKDYIMKIIGF